MQIQTTWKSKYPSSWAIMPVGILGGQSTLIKVGAGAIVGSIATYLFGGAKQMLDQKQEAQAQAQGGGYTFNIEPGGIVYLYDPSTGNVSANTDQQQKGEQSTPDYLQYLVIGGLVIGGLYILSKRRK